MAEIKNILFLTPRYSLPLVGGDRLKQYYLLKHLSSKYNVTMINLYQGNENLEELKKPFTDWGIDTRIFRLNPIKQAFNVLKGMFSFTPAEISFYNTAEYENELNKLLIEKDFDLIFTFFMRAGNYLILPSTQEILKNKKKKIHKVLIAEDCRRVYMDRSYKGSKNILQKAIRFWEAKTLLTYEPNIVNYYDVVTLVSDNDIESMRVNTKFQNYKLLTNGTDINKNRPGEYNKREGLVFVGKLDVYANELMIRKIVTDILPFIIEKNPDVVFNIVGKHANNYIKSLNSKNIKIYEDVKDVNEYLQKSLIFIHPHYSGSGIQNKLIEAMSSGCLVVTTQIGNQGINGTNGENLFMVNNDKEMAEKCNEILANKKNYQNVSENAVKHIRENLSWDRVYKDLDNIISEL